MMRKLLNIKIVPNVITKQNSILLINKIVFFIHFINLITHKTIHFIVFFYFLSFRLYIKVVEIFFVNWLEYNHV